jgi:hypothetical protein
VTVDRGGSRHVKASAVDTYRIVRSHPYPVLLGGYRDGDALLSGREQYELDVWTKHLQDGTVDSMACFRSPVAVSGRAGNDMADALLRWVARHGPPACER